MDALLDEVGGDAACDVDAARACALAQNALTSLGLKLAGMPPFTAACLWLDAVLAEQRPELDALCFGRVDPGERIAVLTTEASSAAGSQLASSLRAAGYTRASLRSADGAGEMIDALIRAALDGDCLLLVPAAVEADVDVLGAAISPQVVAALGGPSPPAPPPPGSFPAALRSRWEQHWHAVRFHLLSAYSIAISTLEDRLPSKAFKADGDRPVAEASAATDKSFGAAAVTLLCVSRSHANSNTYLHIAKRASPYVPPAQLPELYSVLQARATAATAACKATQLEEEARQQKAALQLLAPELRAHFAASVAQAEEAAATAQAEARAKAAALRPEVLPMSDGTLERRAPTAAVAAHILRLEATKQQQQPPDFVADSGYRNSPTWLSFAYDDTFYAIPPEELSRLATADAFWAAYDMLDRASRKFNMYAMPTAAAREAYGWAVDAYDRLCSMIRDSEAMYPGDARAEGGHAYIRKMAFIKASVLGMPLVHEPAYIAGTPYWAATKDAHREGVEIVQAVFEELVHENRSSKRG